MTYSSGTHKAHYLADRIAGFDDPSMGDERERGVILRAFTLAAVISTYILFILAALFAVIGGGLWTVLIILSSGIGGAVIAGYCRREGVDYSMSLARVRPGRLIVSYITSSVIIAVWLFAIAFHQSAGHPLINAGLGSSMGSSSTVTSLVVGALTGAVLAVAISMWSRFRKQAQARTDLAHAAEIADEE